MDNNILKQISYKKVCLVPNIVTGEPIGKLSGHDVARVLYHVSNMFITTNKQFVSLLNKIGTSYKNGDENKKKEMFDLLENDQTILDEILKHCP